ASESVHDGALGCIGAPVVDLADAVAVLVGGRGAAEESHHPHGHDLVPVNVAQLVLDRPLHSRRKVIGEEETGPGSQIEGGPPRYTAGDKRLLQIEAVVARPNEDQ